MIDSRMIFSPVKKYSSEFVGGKGSVEEFARLGFVAIVGVMFLGGREKHGGAPPIANHRYFNSINRLRNSKNGGVNGVLAMARFRPANF